jgi:Na+-transporting NADH:ubiquinone oxidoreductase subunit C
MPMFSNRYIFIYASVLVVLVAVLLSAAANLLKPYQEENIRVEKIQNILASILMPATTTNAETLFDKHITEELVVDPQGNVLSIYRNGKFEKGNTRAFDINLKEEQTKMARYMKDHSAPVPLLPIYVAHVDTSTFYIVPVLGKGLWGPIYGNIAFKDDLNTIEGADFGDEKETPGLGAEIATPAFADQFKGKQIFDAKGNFVSVAVVKGGVKNSKINVVHGVDAISGGTITSNGVANMLIDCLEPYVPFFEKNKK